MKLASLETTPNPNCMKLNLDEVIADQPLTLKPDRRPEGVPSAVAKLIEIQGVQEAFLAQDFVTLTRQGNADWEPILASAARVLGIAKGADAELLARSQSAAGGEATTDSQARSSAPAASAGEEPALGEVEVAVLYFRGIPTQVRATGAEAQARTALPDRFNETMQRVVEATGANYVFERHWEPYGSRYGQPQEVADMVAEELDSAIDGERLARIERAAAQGTPAAEPDETAAQRAEALAQLRSDDWKERLKAIQILDIDAETFPAIVEALQDPRAAVRRWAAVLLGGSEMPEAIEPLSELACRDRSAIVRRTAGDALSDLGDPRATPTMGQLLGDPSKLVRWRAARFLNESGDQRALETLQQAIERECEFDVRLEMNAALERIRSGGERQLPMWMRLSQSGNQPAG
ncbi:MAG: PBS lyase [Cyanobacteria bacterium QS_8_64_29]|nr:MAG: PBS lyase [Cyanobacteria bacterium QS_8_64_29]